MAIAQAADPERQVRRGVAGNRSTPGEILAQLAGDPDESVRLMARANPGGR